MKTNFQKDLIEIRKLKPGQEKTQRLGRILDLLECSWSISTAGHFVPFLTYTGISEKDYEDILDGKDVYLSTQALDTLEEIARISDLNNAVGDNSAAENEIMSAAETVRYVSAQLTAFQILNESREHVGILSQDLLSDLLAGMRQQLEGTADKLDQIRIK